MTNRTRIPGLLLAGGLTLALTPALRAQDHNHPAAAPAPAMSAKEKAAMEAMARAATPGEPHKNLQHFVGKFDAKVKMWEKPGAPPAESTGTSEGRSVLGGRYVAEDFQGTFMGQPFAGSGMTGYDNVQKKYVSTWADTMGTGILVSRGTGDATGKVLTMTATQADPATGKMMTVREKMTIADSDHHTLEMWAPGPDGKEFKMMEIAYTRRK